MTIQARFTFKRDRAAEFLLDGQEVTQLLLDDVQEVINYCEEFRSALLDVNVIDEEGVVTTLSDFPVNS
jgi:hypothetical protein